jgi:hypothetical protein
MTVPFIFCRRQIIITRNRPEMTSGFFISALENYDMGDLRAISASYPQARI